MRGCTGVGGHGPWSGGGEVVAIAVQAESVREAVEVQLQGTREVVEVGLLLEAPGDAVEGSGESVESPGKAVEVDLPLEAPEEVVTGVGAREDVAKEASGIGVFCPWRRTQHKYSLNSALQTLSRSNPRNIIYCTQYNYYR